MTKPKKSLTGAQRIASERQRQIDVEGWTAAHDAHHSKGQLIEAAECYATRANTIYQNKPSIRVLEDVVPFVWPWDKSWWKPSQDPVRNLEKAGALIAAEIDRILAEREREQDTL